MKEKDTEYFENTEALNNIIKEYYEDRRIADIINKRSKKLEELLGDNKKN